ncbi:T9SS type B sorting domain-containing protein [Winogradskyella aurantiaca]|uniref:T9SS type B sorting domain-containing protein n=1 Tax=Winogradskyella aurantiaca TaxID=2219558 RepID=UPI000E1CF5F6|nr:T9SS type B sorting domain-containing protein [Winogradskyella aurantiaca]
MRRPNLRIVYLIHLVSAISFAQGPPPQGSEVLGITVTHNQYYCPEAPIPIVESVEITNGSSTSGTLDQVFIQISEGYQGGQDLLTFGGTGSGITSTWSPSEGILTLSGTATFDAYEVAIENVAFQTDQSVYTANRSISINLGTASYLPSTGHYYQYVAASGISWNEARDAAAAETYFGLQGYLVTLTSQEEAQLAGEQSPGTGWIGGSDEETEGIWKWVTGPEAGTVFWEGAVSGAPPAGQFAFWNCGEPNDFGGNEDYAHITDNSVAGCGNNIDPDLFGSWNDLPIDSGGTDPSNPYYPRGYIIEFGGMPDEPEISLSASSVINMPQVEIVNLSVCGPGTHELSVSGNADAYYWYDSPAADNLLHIGETYTVTLNTSQTFWISPRFLSCPVGGVSPLSVSINDIPDAINQSVTQCDSEGDSDGISLFNLSLYDNDVAGGDLTNREVWHYEDALLTERIDSQVYTNQFNGQIVFARVRNTITGCVNVSQIELNVTAAQSNSAYLEECDDFQEDGFTTFDLSEADDQVNVNPGSGVTTAYFESYEDALTQSNQLPTIYSNTKPYYQIIYVRLQEGNNCFGINEVELVVRGLPKLKPDETVYYCLNSFPDSIVIDGGLLEGIPNNYYYNWSTGETTIAIEVNEPGTYSVEVSEVMGCSNFRTITVLPSEVAMIEEIEVDPVGELNTISVDVSGSGEYIYSIDSAFGPFQSSNIFTNVPPGVITVYVKDIKGGCGVSSEEVSVVGYPKFFTPNGDGRNDTWGISGFNSNFPFVGVVSIFNRHGKLITTLTTTNSFWDGTYNGSLLPANDYWFIAELEEGRVLTGHFALKR